MLLTISENDLSTLVNRQIYSLWGKTIELDSYQEKVLARLEMCFIQNANKYYEQNGKCVFSPYHSVQYSIYLYYLAHLLYKMGGERENAEVLYCLNKALHSVDWYYEISLPDIFGAEHPLGSVLGRAAYSNYFFFYQGCTVGGSNGKYPTLGENVIMYSNCSILGNSQIGNNVVLGAGTQIVNTKVPDNCLVFGKSPNLAIVKKDKDYMLGKTAMFWKHTSYTKDI